MTMHASLYIYMVRSGKASLILDFGTIPVLPGTMCCGVTWGKYTVSSNATILVISYPVKITCPFVVQRSLEMFL